MNPIIFTFTTEAQHPGFLRMQRLAKAKGWDIDARIGPWPGEHEMWQMFWDSLPRYKAEGRTHALRLDAWDIIPLGEPFELLGALYAYANPALLVSAEVACWPGDHRKSEYPPSWSPWMYAHSPATVDLGQALPEQLFQNRHAGYGADQKHFGDLVLDKVPGVAIDHQCRVVQTLGHCHPWQSFFDKMPTGRLLNKLTGTQPLFCHANGRCDDQWVEPY